MTTDVRPADHDIELRGLRLHYLEWGTPGAPAMVLLHGLTSHAHSWDVLARALQDRYHIIALDQRGHGDSAWPADHRYGTTEYVADAKALVDALGLERFVLAGLSMGAHNSIAFAAAHLDQVTHLIPIDIPPALHRMTEQRQQTAAQQPPPRVFASTEEAFQHARSLNPRPPEDVQRARVEWSLKPLPDGRVELKYDPDAPKHWQPDDLWSALPRITSPTLVIRGSESEVLPADVAEQMTAAFPNARLVTVTGAGHPVPLDRPAAFERAVREFLGMEV